MKRWILAVALFVSCAPARAQLAGRLDLGAMPTFGAWQSINSADQALGISERFFHLDYESQPLVNLSLFAGATKPMFSAPALPVRFLAGDVVQFPGSSLDWALGTKWGDAWLPKLKVGILFAHDLTRLAKTHLFGEFQGIGATWPFGS